jgi:hypothetical protein
MTMTVPKRREMNSKYPHLLLLIYLLLILKRKMANVPKELTSALHVRLIADGMGKEDSQHSVIM